MIPGLLCTVEVFAAQAVALWPYGPVMVASTLEGTTMSEMAAAILASGPPRFALAGISMGGYIAFEIMRQAPERVLKLALLDTTARPDMPVQTQMRREQLAKVRTGDAMAQFAEALKGLMLPAHRDDARIAAVNARMAAAVGVEGFARQTEAIIGRVDSRPGLGAITVPTMVLVGDGDPVTPLDRAEEMAAAIPKARLVVVPACGHLATLEQPEAVNRALVEWIGW